MPRLVSIVPDARKSTEQKRSRRLKQQWAYNTSPKGRARAIRYNRTAKGRARTGRYEATTWRRTYKQFHGLTGHTPYNEEAHALALMAEGQEAMAAKVSEFSRRPTKIVNAVCSCHHVWRRHMSPRHIPLRAGGIA